MTNRDVNIRGISRAKNEALVRRKKTQEKRRLGLGMGTVVAIVTLVQ
jgi:hypothetical protein